MKKMTLLVLFLSVSFFAYARGESLFSRTQCSSHADAEWVIVGAGPAGIIVLGVLLDLGTDPRSIIWIDPEFGVGRMGKYYSTVPGNAKTKQFIEFLNCCQTFQKANSPALTKLYDLDQELEYPLKYIVDPLSDISNYLCSQVNCKIDSLRSLEFANDVWHVGTSKELFTSAHVILATGSHPKTLNYPVEEEIPLDVALCKESLSKIVTEKDTVAVVGSAQSAILLLKYLCEINRGRTVNFYKTPPDFDTPETSLKGTTARWAREVLLKDPPINLLRLYNCPDSMKAWLPICTKIIYAVGFERNQLPTIANAPYINFEDANGMIGPRLFGIGIAFPEKYTAEDGKIVSRIGLMSFMEYAQEILPCWMATKNALTRFSSFDDLLDIDIL